MSLTEFLLARIAEDEEAARLATQGSPGDSYGAWHEGVWDDGPTVSVFGYPSDRTILRGEESYDVEHAIRWQPARVLAECEAKRRLLSLHAEGDDGRCGECADKFCVTPWNDVCEVAALLAMPYADHPDYSPYWKP